MNGAAMRFESYIGTTLIVNNFVLKKNMQQIAFSLLHESHACWTTFLASRTLSFTQDGRERSQSRTHHVHLEGRFEADLLSGKWLMLRFIKVLLFSHDKVWFQPRFCIPAAHCFWSTIFMSSSLSVTISNYFSIKLMCFYIKAFKRYHRRP